MKKLTKEEVEKGIIAALEEVKRKRAMPSVDGHEILQKLLAGTKRPAPKPTLPVETQQGIPGQPSEEMPPGGNLAERP